MTDETRYSDIPASGSNSDAKGKSARIGRETVRERERERDERERELGAFARAA